MSHGVRHRAHPRKPRRVPRRVLQLLQEQFTQRSLMPGSERPLSEHFYSIPQAHRQRTLDTFGAEPNELDAHVEGHTTIGIRESGHEPGEGAEGRRHVWCSSRYSSPPEGLQEDPSTSQDQLGHSVTRRTPREALQLTSKEVAWTSEIGSCRAMHSRSSRS